MFVICGCGKFFCVSWFKIDTRIDLRFDLCSSISVESVLNKC